MNQKEHWEQVYSNNPTNMGWYEPHLETSLSWIKGLNLPADAPLIDVGGGASTLVDDLLDAGYGSITVLDIAASALETARKRLGTIPMESCPDNSTTAKCVSGARICQRELWRVGEQ